jgi:hypothetical protein
MGIEHVGGVAPLRRAQVGDGPLRVDGAQCLGPMTDAAWTLGLGVDARPAA